MTNEEKQALIEGCTQRVDALSKYCRVNPDEREASLDLSLCKIALAALTTQPVKLPDVRIFCNSNKSHRKVIYAVTDAIRAAGYEVQE